jgi:4-hydroxy-3-polyprenylbenzoate decarboxylase
VEQGLESSLSDEDLLKKMKKIDDNILSLKQYFTETKTPICLITVNKTKSIQSDIDKLDALAPHVKLLVIVDNEGNDLDNPYMLLWRVVNNIDAQRDVRLEPFILIDGTHKGMLDGYEREWPGDTLCTREVLDDLRERGLIDIDDDFIHQWGLL